MKRHLVIALLGFFAISLSSIAESRSVFLNGTDISSSRGQELKNVSIHINEKGDVFIIAPHYQVNEEDSYVPLSKFVQGINRPVHKKPHAVSELGAGTAGFGTSIPIYENGQIKKVGDPSPSVAKNNGGNAVEGSNTNENDQNTPPELGD